MRWWNDQNLFLSVIFLVLSHQWEADISVCWVASLLFPLAIVKLAFKVYVGLRSTFFSPRIAVSHLDWLKYGLALVAIDLRKATWNRYLFIILCILDVDKVTDMYYLYFAT